MAHCFTPFQGKLANWYHIVHAHNSYRHIGFKMPARWSLWFGLTLRNVTRPFATVLVNSMLPWKSWELGAWQFIKGILHSKRNLFATCVLHLTFARHHTFKYSWLCHRCSKYTTVSDCRPFTPTLHNVKSRRQRAEVHQWRSGFEAFLWCKACEPPRIHGAISKFTRCWEVRKKGFSL